MMDRGRDGEKIEGGREGWREGGGTDIHSRLTDDAKLDALGRWFLLLTTRTKINK